MYRFLTINFKNFYTDLKKMIIIKKISDLYQELLFRYGAFKPGSDAIDNKIWSNFTMYLGMLQ